MTSKIMMVVAGAFLTLAATGGTAQTVPADWKTDCVGRMQVSLPGEADIAAIRPKDHVKNLLGGQAEIGYKFADGQDASWSSSNGMKITHPVTSEEKTAIDNAIAKLWTGAQDYASRKSEETGQIYALTELPKSEYVRLGWKGKDYFSAFLFVEETAIDWFVSTEESDMPNVARYYQLLTTGLRPRPTFDVPKAPGVCLPYLFIQDDGKEARHVGMTYRLKAHPDITVWLEDGTAAIIDTHQDPAKFTANAKAAFFWEQRYQNRLTFQSLWPEHRAFKPTTFAGQPGTKTFVELTRNDDKRTKDYGYLIAVRGDPNTEKDTPDLMLYVIQDSANAVSRGIKPLSKAAFFKMAETIAASVKRRETSLR